MDTTLRDQLTALGVKKFRVRRKGKFGQNENKGVVSQPEKQSAKPAIDKRENTGNSQGEAVWEKMMTALDKMHARLDQVAPATGQSIKPVKKKSKQTGRVFRALTAEQASQLNAHAKSFDSKHIKSMRLRMRLGKSFDEAHSEALKKFTPAPAEDQQQTA